jgi:cysteinyl-tRNA synthetase
MALTLYNSLTHAKEPFRPLRPDAVGMYACGPTVYDFAHIGNARMVVVFDLLYRVLRHSFGTVTYVRNITDVDDKIIDAARRNGEAIDALTKRTAEAFHAHMAALGALPPTIEPRATQHIGEMIAMIQALIAKGHAYDAQGHVLFAVHTNPHYGHLSRQTQEGILEGARVEVAPYKRDAADFVLWKPSTSEQPGWDSPWGRGRPGWHIECSAMAERYLGETFDIHGGGRDLIFPHHENEIAQSSCAHCGKPLARTWVHNGFITVRGEKMAKSVGNIVTVNDLLPRYDGETIRLTLLAAQYRQGLDWTDDAVEQAKKALDRWYRAADNAKPAATVDAAFLAALEDDLNTPAAIARLHGLADAALAGDTAAASSLKASGGLLGVLGKDADAWFRAAPAGTGKEQIDALIAERAAAKKARNFAEADRIRKLLLDQGIVLEDSAQGTTWRRAS